MDRKGKPIKKSIWELDYSVVAGKPVHELVHYCLVELAGKGASLDQLRDYCNEKGIPGRRKKFWSTSTWNALLKPSLLLQFAGFGVWNVHRKNGTMRPPSEWVVVENAHPAILSEEEVHTIAAARQKQKRAKKFDTGFGKSRKSHYLLSGGLFKCGRCGENMTGRRPSRGRTYYICGSQPYRRGKGCGPGVYVPQVLMETEVCIGIEELLGVCSDPGGFTKRVNAHLRKIWEQSTGYDPNREMKIGEIDSKIANIHKAIEEGLSDATWANTRLKELTKERATLSTRTARADHPPQIDPDGALSYRTWFKKLLAEGKRADLKNLVRTLVQKITLAPEERVIEITFRLPEPVVNGVVAGAGFEPATFGL